MGSRGCWGKNSWQVLQAWMISSMSLFRFLQNTEVLALKFVFTFDDQRVTWKGHRYEVMQEQ